MKSLELTEEDKDYLAKFIAISKDVGDPDSADFTRLAIYLQKNDLYGALSLAANTCNDRLFGALFKVLINSYSGLENVLKTMEKIPKDLLYTRLFRDTAVVVPDTIKYIDDNALNAWTAGSGEIVKAVFIPRSVKFLHWDAVNGKTKAYFEVSEDEARKFIKGGFDFDKDSCEFNYTREQFIQEWEEYIV